MLSLINPLLIPSMLLERCSTHPGSLTPLALWLVHQCCRDGPERSEQTLSTLLNIASPTGQKHLELLDGSGNTALHTAVNNLMGQQLKQFLSYRADILHRENAVGTTPLELAENKWVAKMTSDPPAAPRISESRWPGYNLGSCDIVHQPPQNFVKGQGQENGRKNWTERAVLGLCQEMNHSAGENGDRMDESEGGHDGQSNKRKLVSLFDANEVAKRLAAGGKGGVRGYRRRYVPFWQDHSCGGGDEVSKWL